MPLLNSLLILLTVCVIIIVRSFHLFLCIHGYHRLVTNLPSYCARMSFSVCVYPSFSFCLEQSQPTKKLILYNLSSRRVACDQYERSILQLMGKFIWQIDTVFWQVQCNGIVDHRSLNVHHPHYANGCWPDGDTVGMMITT